MSLGRFLLLVSLLVVVPATVSGAIPADASAWHGWCRAAPGSVLTTEVS